MEAGLPDRLADQKRSIATINGSPPQLAYGCVVSFPTWRAVVRLDVFDPEENETDAEHIQLELDAFILAYYRPFMAALDFIGPAVERGPYVTATNEVLGLRIGVLSQIAERIDAVQARGSAGLFRRVVDILHSSEVRQAGLADGTMVRTRWSEGWFLDDWDLP